MLHGNISWNGDGNAMIRRYGGCFEEYIMRLMYDRAYLAKDLDAPVKFAPTPMRRAMHGTEEASKIWIGGSSNNRILTLVKGTHSLIIRNCQSSQEIHKEPSNLRGVYGGLVILAHPHPMIREGTLLQPCKD